MKKFLTSTSNSNNQASEDSSKPNVETEKSPTTEETKTPFVVIDTENEKVDLKNKRKKSIVWDHFTIIKGGDPKNPRCECNYCGAEYACDSRRHGTSSMKVHLEHQCKKYPYRIEDKKQKLLSFQTKTESGNSLLAIGFNKDNCRKALAKMVIVDELSFRFVEGKGFRDFCLVMQPRFIPPSRVTVARDIYQLFLDERKKLKVELSKSGQRVCLTTDCWTSLQNINYMCLTAHYVDSEWTLQKRILNFCQISSHKGEAVGKVIEACLHAWGIERVFTITVDNASSNDTMIAYLKRKIKGWKGVILDGEFLHIRCCAHIINLIVNEGLKELHDSIVAIRNSVRYVRSSPARLLKFKSCVEREKIECKGLLVLDVPTRWNSTYLMLEAAIKFEKAFERYEEEDEKFLSYFHEDEGGKGKVGPPLVNDWTNAKVFVKFLKTFYDITLKFSATLNVTSNTYFHELCEMQNQLTSLSKEDDSLLSAMAVSMRRKYDKYWGNVYNVNCLLFVALVLDPRYKMDYLAHCFTSIYDSSITEKLLKKVKETMNQLFDFYSGAESGNVLNENEGEVAAKTQNEEGKDSLWTSFLKKRKEKSVCDSKNEVERYLLDPVEDPVSEFDVLTWWKENSLKYKVLSQLARDTLAIPVSTVASESAFSTGGRILDAFRSSLSPKMVEALICSQNWLRSRDQINLMDYMDEVNAYEDIDSGNFYNLLVG